MFLELLAFFPLFLLPLLFFILKPFGDSKTSNNSKLPKSYPIIGSFPAIYKNYANRLPWFTDLVKTSSTSTITMHHSLGNRFVVTANPAVVQHILKTKFHVYQKGESFRTTLQDLLGDGIFNADGDNWKFQRQLSSHEFNTKSLRKFVEQVVDTELYDRLIPILSKSSNERTVLDFQDILQRFAFDNICRIGFGYDPEYLLPSLPQAKFAVAFDDAVQISGDRFTSMRPVWKIKRAFGIGSESHLRRVVSDVREFANTIVRQKKREMDEMKTMESHDLLSRFLSSGHSDEKFVTDMVISFTLAGRDTTSAALTWFFWLVANHPSVESEILKEINEKVETGAGYDEAKDMVYTHAALCESMRLYPPVPTDSKEAVEEDVLPDGTKVKKGMTVTYHVYAMGRMEQIWGEDWAEFRPERWLERDVAADKWKFVGKDSFSYPVFQAGPRICLGKEMAFLQMKRVVGGVLKRFKVVSEKRENGKEPEFVASLTAKMKGGFPVTVIERA
ncbi:PREDICTED: cytochrome P450 94A1-like [Fragaria vesca subsp. vesca]|uniref:cytochrome P450 94A1-like n=1 Tax=Fragaria vesca subsp. vesca TaxID=101020 RepID=UPI0002C33553|nr:PREDICTED: cytochrome P450 94A1-like [Fragaria vesca subsp. vesca]